jgi:peptidoglycan/xylan/chitin deacetylase (PgdA/CDA1 family)
MYHSLDTKKFPNKLSLTPELFESQMRFLAGGPFSAVSLEECLKSRSKGGFCDLKTVITFDDGYLDNYTLAFPIIKRLRLPATFFVSADRVGQDGYMDWKMLKEMSDTPRIEIGSHGTGHVPLAEVPSQIAKRSVEESKMILEDGLGREVSAFSYPSGSFTEETVEIVKRAGYRLACAASHVGEKRFLGDPYCIRRIKISATSGSILAFVFRLSGFYNLFSRP